MAYFEGGEAANVKLPLTNQKVEHIHKWKWTTNNQHPQKSVAVPSNHSSTIITKSPKSPQCPKAFRSCSLANRLPYVYVYENNVRLVKYLCSNQSAVLKWMWEKDKSGLLPRASMPQEVIILGLERKADQRAFMRKKLSSERLNGKFFPAVDCAIDTDCLRYHAELLKLSPPKSFSLKDVSLAAVGIVYSWKRLFATMIEDNVPHLILFESDVYFCNFTRVRAEWKSITSYYMVYMGGHQSIYSDQQLQQQKKAMDSKLFGHYRSDLATNNIGKRGFKPSVIFGAYGLIISRPMMRIIYLCLNWILEKPDRFLPVDWIDDSIMTYLQQSVPVMYPNVVVPEIRESDNIGARNLSDFERVRRVNYNQAKHIGIYYPWRKMGEMAMKSAPNELWGANNLLGENLTHLNKFGEDFMRYTTMFAVIITTYNIESVINRTIESVCNQVYPYFRLIIFDDCSSDSTMALIQETLSRHAICNRRSILLSVPRRFGQAFARQAALKHVHDAEVAFFLDGDDFLATKHSLGQLEEVFQNPLRWPLNHSSGQRVKPLMTYGNYVRLKDDIISNIAFNVKYFPSKVITNNEYRNHSWITHHPLVAVGWLAKSVPHTAVMGWRCDWLVMNSDLAQSLYMLEHSGGASTRTNITLYVYNYDHSIKTTDSYYKPANNKIHLQIENWIRGRIPSPITGKFIFDHISNDTCKDQAERDMKLVVDLTYLLRVSTLSQ